MADMDDPVASGSRLFTAPVKRIVSSAHLQVFKSSSTHDELFDFILRLNNSVIDKTLTSVGEPSSAVTRSLLDILNAVHELACATPAVDNTLSRFGNPAFRTFYDKVAEASGRLHAMIPGLSAEAVPELEVYFKQSWGSRERIDYGSGMELNFVCWLLCLHKMGLVRDDDSTFLVLGIFWRYIKVMRYLQSTYWLEPAGSHGVWGLDDYQFLPFLWGSAQLRDHKHLRPKAIHDEEILEAFAPAYMYLSCIKFINSIKTASLRWHSPMLDDISAVKTWSKVNSGMMKMYDAEVLGKLPVMQHMFFGSLLPFPEDPQLPNMPGDLEHGHVHEKGWQMDCCGIPGECNSARAVPDVAVPSAFGQAHQAGLKPIPFD
ncbi:putative Phosphotyrosyl phosphatase activator [Kockovaella imperatae]|uniref:Serine/threonine-protein phosphatase 2A activator n=1 Tax=Kockovaella imperatae TaxID=4999 RepID=A0A1Y1UFY7_9TREE|nr:putative Phosphotyrosyl phosphatase activator [Kockovaella imperatae]ORX36447.1 putative Phosphotyrosyl phosphatase activator [Kockovaella imperatae]